MAGPGLMRRRYLQGAVLMLIGVLAAVGVRLAVERLRELGADDEEPEQVEAAA